MNRAEHVESAILDALVDSFVLNRASLVDEVAFEWKHPGERPPVAEIESSVTDLLRRSWLEETELVERGKAYAVLRLTDTGKAEWRRRNPLEDRLDEAWYAQGDFIYAPSEEIADKVTRELSEEFGLRDYDQSTKTVEPWTYELDGTGDVIHGVRATYAVERTVGRALRDLVGTAVALLRLRVASLLASRRRH